MRIADSMTFDQVRGNIGKNRSQMSELQNQAASQKRVNKPSDDPVAASRVLQSRIDYSGDVQYIKNLNYAKSFLDTTDLALGEVSENLMRLKELAINQANDASANEESRQVVATEVEQVFNQMVSIGNRKLGDRFIFGGFKTQSQPFSMEGHYQGDEGEMMIHIDKSTFLPMNIAGSRIFLGQGINSNGVVKSSPEQAQTIEAFREQRRAALREQAEKPEVESPELDVQKLEAGGEEGAQGEAEATLRGPASVVPVPEVTAEAQGANLFNVINSLSTSLRTNDKQGVQDCLEILDETLSQVVLARSQIGSRSMAVGSLVQSLERSKVDNQASISSHEDADVFATMSDITKTEGTLQATLQTAGKLVQPSLLQFLR